jgi:hypothetical protein
MKLNSLVFGTLFALSLPTISMAQFSQSCDNYPVAEGSDLQIDPATGNPSKIMFTAMAGVDFDDVSDIKLATDTATIEAKAGIAKFIKEEVNSDQGINNAINKSSTMTGGQKQAVKEETTTALKNLSNNASAVLRGVVVLAGCYTKGKLVKVTVGLKPESIAAAASMAGAIGSSPASTSQPQQQNTPQQNTGMPAQTTPLNGMNGFNNSSRVKNF